MPAPTKASLDTAAKMNKLLEKTDKLITAVSKNTVTYGKKSKSVWEKNLKDINDVNNDLDDMAKGVRDLQGALGKAKSKGTLDSGEVSKYNDELKKVNDELLTYHNYLKKAGGGGKLTGAALTSWTGKHKKELDALKGKYSGLNKKIGNLTKNSGDWTDAVARTGPTFAKNWVKFRKETAESIKDYKIMGDKLGQMPGLFKAAGGMAKGLGSIIGGVTKMLTKWPGLLLFAVKAIVDMAMAADQFVKDSNKAFAAIRGPDIMTGDIKKQFKDFNDMIFRAGENIRVGLDVTQIRELMSAAKEAGANITNLNKGLLSYRDAIYVASKASKTLGLELPMIGSMMGKMMIDMRMDLDQMDKSFVQVAFDAKKSGLSTDRFWTTVQNASASMALYGVIVKSASNTMKAFTENMVGGADDAAAATENMYDVFKSGSLKANLAIIQFAKRGGMDVPKVFEEMAEEAAGRVKVVEGNIKFIEDKGGKKTSEDVVELKKLRSELYAAQSKQSRFQKAAEGDDMARAAEAGALAKRAPEMIISALTKAVGRPLHTLMGNQLEVAIKAGSVFEQNEKTVRMLVEISKVTEKRMTDLANKSANFFQISTKGNERTRERIAKAITGTSTKTGDAQIRAADALQSLLENKLGMMPDMAGDVVKLVKNDKKSADEIVKHLQLGKEGMAKDIAKVIGSSRAIQKMSGAHFKDQDKTESDMSKAADKTYKDIVEQTLSFNEMVKIAKDDVQWRVTSMKLMSKVNSGVWNILRVIIGNKPYLTEEQLRNKELLKAKGIDVKQTKDGHIILTSLGKQIRENVVEAEKTRALVKEQNSLIGAMEKGDAGALVEEFKRVSAVIGDLKGKAEKGKITGAEKQQLEAAQKTEKTLNKLGVGGIASTKELISVLETGVENSIADLSDGIRKLSIEKVRLKTTKAAPEEIKAVEDEIEKKKAKKAQVVKLKGMSPKEEKKLLADQRSALVEMNKSLKKGLPDMIKEEKNILKKNQEQLIKQDETVKQLTGMSHDTKISGEIQKQILLSTEEGRKRVRDILKGKTGPEETFGAAAALGFSDEKETLDILKEGVGKEDDITKEQFDEIAKNLERGYKDLRTDTRVAEAFEKRKDVVSLIPEQPVKTQRQGKKSKPKKVQSDFFDIIKGGFVNVKSGDILVDKDSFAQGTGGPPGAAIPSMAPAAAGGAGGGATTINIKVDATEKDLAGKIANQIKKELYNRSISTSSYSLA